MRERTLNLPSLGFWILLASYTAAFGFLCFGSQKPRLETAFDLLSRRERDDFSAYSVKDVDLLEGVLHDYPGFVRALVGRGSARFLEPRVDGWLRLERAHLALRPDPKATLRVTFEVRGEPREFPLTLTIGDQGKNKQLTFDASGVKSVEFSRSELSKAGIWAFQVKASKASKTSAEAASWGVRIVPQTTLPATREAP
jgi:hypothetical protein